MKNEAKMELQGQFFKRLKQILKENEVECDDKILVKLIQRYYPDWRRLINECQRHAATGKSMHLSWLTLLTCLSTIWSRP